MPSFEFRGLVLLYRVINIIFQTLFYGMYLCLVLISVYVMMPRGFRTRSRVWLFVMTMIMFVLSTVYWVLSVIVTFLVINAWFSKLDPATHDPPNWLPMFNAIILVNYTLADVVVVWRAWVLCADCGRAFLMMPVVCLAINAFVYVATVVVRAGLFLTPEDTQIHRNLAHVIDITQVADLTFSLLTNVLATSIIAVRTWKFRKSLIMRDAKTRISSPASQILVLLVESGLLYSILGATVLASSFIRLPYGTLDDILIPISVQLAGMYPIIVLLLVDQKCSLRATTHICSGSVRDIAASEVSRIEPIIFVPGKESAGSLTTVDKIKPRSGVRFSILSTTGLDGAEASVSVVDNTLQ